MIDFRKQVAALEVIHEIYAESRTPRLTDELLTRFGDEAIETKIQTGPLYCTAGSIAIRVNRVMQVFVGGIAGQAMAFAVAEGYGYPSAIAAVGGWNPAFVRDARTIGDRAFGRLLRPGDSLELYGHSAGGAVCEALAQAVQDQYPSMPITIDTFGSPCPSEAGTTVAGPHLVRRRWMNQNDPVPLIPFFHLDSGEWAMIIALSGQLRPGVGVNPQPQRFVQPGPGYALYAGRFRPAADPPVNGNRARQARAWIERQPQQLEDHDAGTYLLKMRALLRIYPNGTEEPSDSPRPTHRRPPSIEVVMPYPLPYAEERNVVMPIVLRPDGIALDLAGDVVGTVTFTENHMAFLKLNPRYAFKRVKVGQTWQATLNGQVILSSDEPKTPRTFVKRGNQFLRSIGTENTLWLDAFLEAFRSYANAAANTPGVTLPPMRVDT